METIKCPVCGNPGIPDYHCKDVVCPHCGSNLGIYKTLSDAANSGKKDAGLSLKYKMLAFVLPIATALIVGIASLICFNKAQKSYQNELSVKEKCISDLNNEITVLTDKLQKAQAPEQDFINYVVVKNDGPWGIIQKVFGDTDNWVEKYAQIAKDNGFWDENKSTWKMIHPGQILRIKKDN